MAVRVNHALPKQSFIPTGRQGEMTEFMTTDEVAQILRTPVETVRYWRHINKGPRSFKVGRRVLYAREDVEQFIALARGAGV
jgi:excisionase family DNA binding protein